MTKPHSFTIPLLLITAFNGLLIIGRWYMNRESAPFPDSIEALLEGRFQTFLFLVWNLFLAWLPYIAARTFNKMDKKGSALWLTAPVFLFWLGFFPNAPYLITDLIHLHPRPTVPYWYDISVFFSFALTGLLLGLTSMLEIEAVLRRRLSAKWLWPSMLLLIAACSFGIWLGRFMRWNTWDVLTNPFDLVYNLFDIFTTPQVFLHALGISTLMGGMILVNYLLLRRVRL